MVPNELDDVEREVTKLKNFEAIHEEVSMQNLFYMFILYCDGYDVFGESASRRDGKANN